MGTSSPRPDWRAPTLAEAQDLRARIAADPVAATGDVPEFADRTLATRLRIGGTAAILWGAVDLPAGTVEVRGTVIRIRGHGLVLEPRPKSRSGWRMLEIPSRAVAMLHARRPLAPDPRTPH